MKKNLFKCLSISLLSLFAISSCDDISDLLEEKPTADTQDKPAEENNSSTDKPKEEVKEETFKVVWHNGSVILETDEEVKKGSQPEYNGNKPTKSSDDDYDYSFLGWNTNPNATSPLSTLPNVEANLDFYAIFKANAIIKYSIKFFNQGKEITSAAKSVKTGKYNIKSDLYSLESPTKAEDSVGKYSFKGWSLSRPSNDLDGNIVTEIEVSADMELHASFILAKNSYKVIWMNETIQHDETIHVYGEIPKPDASNPTKAATAQYTYTFLGWNSDSKATSPLDSLPIVSANATYYAIYSKTDRLYRITWKNYNGADLGYNDYKYNVTPNYSGSTPTRSSDSQYSYSFIGWNTDKNATTALSLPNVTKDETYYAIFKATPLASTVTFYYGKDHAKSFTQSVNYGSRPTYETVESYDVQGYRYKFVGWSDTKGATTAQYKKEADFPTITSDRPFYAVYSSEVATYKIVWYLDEECSTSFTTPGTFSYDQSIPSSAYPTTTPKAKAKHSDPKYTYKFEGWYPGYEGMFNGQAWQLLGDDVILSQLNYIDLSTIKIRSDMYMYPVFKIENAPGAVYGNNQFKSWNDLITEGYITVNSSTKALSGAKAKLNTLSNISLFLDDSVKSIADNAFKDVTTLTRVYFGYSQCTTIGSYAFSGCTGLTSDSIIHSDYLTTIKAYAFNGTSNAFHELPGTITAVNQNAFAGITGVSNNNPLTIHVKGLTSQQITSKGIFKSGWNGSISNYQVKDKDGNKVTF